MIIEERKWKKLKNKKNSTMRLLHMYQIDWLVIVRDTCIQNDDNASTINSLLSEGIVQIRM